MTVTRHAAKSETGKKTARIHDRTLARPNWRPPPRKAGERASLDFCRRPAAFRSSNETLSDPPFSQDFRLKIRLQTPRKLSIFRGGGLQSDLARNEWHFWLSLSSCEPTHALFRSAIESRAIAARFPDTKRVKTPHCCDTRRVGAVRYWYGGDKNMERRQQLLGHAAELVANAVRHSHDERYGPNQ